MISSSITYAKKIKVLLADGPQKAHKFHDTTPVLKQILDKVSDFETDLTRSSKESCADGSYKPDFSMYDVVVINEGYGAPGWPKATQKAFEEYMAKGGGLVTVHAANNCWPKWKEYNKMAGLGGWAGRNEKSGPYVYFDEEDKIIRDTSKGKGGPHGPDELYDKLRGPAENMTILASAHSKKTKRHEPTLMAISYKKGRVFHSILGHHIEQIKEGSFVNTFLRGTE